MADRIDSSRDDRVREERQRGERTRSRTRQNKTATFDSQYQGMVHAKKKGEIRLKDRQLQESKQLGQERSRADGALFAEAVEALKKQDDTRGQLKKNEGQKDFKKDEKVKTDVRDAREGVAKRKSAASESHQRVESSESHQHHSEQDGSFSGGGGGGGGGGSGGGSGGRFGDAGKSDQGFAGNSDRAFTSQDYQKGLKSQKETKKAFGVNPIEKTFTRTGEKDFSRERNFKSQHLDSLVRQVFVGLEKGLETMEIHLADSVYHGLSFKVQRTAEGLEIFFRCPNREVKKTFSIHRPMIYTRLREKNILVTHIHVE